MSCEVDTVSVPASDTVAVISSPPGEGAIAVIRMTGPESTQILEKVFRSKGNSGFEHGKQQFGQLLDGEVVVDEVVVAFNKGPSSYTGEDVAEIYCHGGILVTGKVLDLLLNNGAVAARPGEFTERAFLNGKMDLTRAEAVMDLIRAQTDLALRSASEQLQGKLGVQILELRDQLLAVLAHVEAFIDFPDEDIDPETGSALDDRLQGVIDAISQLLDTADQGRILREGLRTIIFGEPNVGKSSLLNLLLGYERAIVSEQAGTTRDTIEEVLNVKGVPIRLIDTAGLRESSDTIEMAGMARTHKALELADLMLHVVDGSAVRPDEFKVGDEREILILNKSDLGIHESWNDMEGVHFSCTAEQGIDALEEKVLALASFGNKAGGSAVAINARHKASLLQAHLGCVAARDALEENTSAEFVAVDLRSALDSLGDVVGKVDSEDLLGEIFGSFCIGK